MKRRVVLAALAATGGLGMTVLLQSAAAVADVSPTGEDAFSIGTFTFDPYTLGVDGAEVEGFSPVPQFISAPPVLELGGISALGLNLSPQSLEVFSRAGVDLGSVDTNVTVASLFGLTNTEFTVTGATTITNLPLPAVGSVYDVFNLGNGYENVYSAIPGALDGGDTVTDTLITPFGSIDLTPIFGTIDAAAALQPGVAFADLQAGTTAIGHDAFSLGGINWDPIQDFSTEGFKPVASTAGFAPLLTVGGGSVGDPAGFSLLSQDLNIFTVDGSTATQIGYVSTGIEVTNLLGATNTQLVVTGVNPLGGNGIGLPTIGSVYDAFRLASGYTNVYIAIPGTDGGPDTVTDTLITPNGAIDLTPLFGNFDAAAPLQPGDAFAGLPGADSGIGADAFTIGGLTFDPTLAGGGEGFDPVYQTIGVPPLLLIGGGIITFPAAPGDTPAVLPLAVQSFDVYDDNTALGSITTDENVINLLGLINTEFTVTGVTQTGDGTLPTVGSVYDVFNFGGGYENIYIAIAGVNGSADTITDTFVTPMGSYNLDPLIDAIAALNPGDAFAGLEAVASATTAGPLAFLGL